MTMTSNRNQSGFCQIATKGGNAGKASVLTLLRKLQACFAGVKLSMHVLCCCSKCMPFHTVFCGVECKCLIVLRITNAHSQYSFAMLAAELGRQCSLLEHRVVYSATSLC